MLAFLYALCSSRIGRTLVAIKQNEPLVRAQGIAPMPYKLSAFAISAAVTGAAGGVFTFHLGIIFDTTAKFYWIAWVFSVAMLAFLYALCSSRIGRTLIAIKQNEPLVRAQGIAPMPYKLASFAIAAAVTGAAGGVFAFHLRVIDPGFLDFYYMQTFLIIVIIGGAGSFWGVIAAGIALSALPEVLRFSADFRMIIYGVILVVAMFVMPTGVAGWLRERQLARMREQLR